MNTASFLLCLVIGISDGDTITARCGDMPQLKVRLAEIDAPEKKQAYGKQAKQTLSNMIYMQEILIDPLGKDRYGRTLGYISHGDTDINRQMVIEGMAWCYKQYLKDPSCLSDEAEARKNKRGLWNDVSPIPPWEWRIHKKHHH